MNKYSIRFEYQALIVKAYVKHEKNITSNALAKVFTFLRQIDSKDYSKEELIIWYTKQKWMVKYMIQESKTSKHNETLIDILNVLEIQLDELEGEK